MEAPGTARKVVSIVELIAGALYRGRLMECASVEEPVDPLEVLALH